MIKMGEITCRIPSNGIKWEILYCTEPEGYRLDIWGVGIDLAMAGLTALLFIIAFLALGTAKGTLKRMQIDGDRQWAIIKEQISEQDRIARAAALADRELAREQHQNELLVAHVKAIRDLQMMTRHADADLIEALSDLSITWATWSMYLHGKNETALDLTQKYCDSLSVSSQIVAAEVVMFHAHAISEDKLKSVVETWGDCVGNYIGNLTAWQAMEDVRPEKEKNMRINLHQLNLFIRENEQQESNA